MSLVFSWPFNGTFVLKCICFLTEFRECFYLFARSGQIRTLDELTIIMRSLGMSPTIQELKKYLKDKGKLPINYKIHCVMKAKCLLFAATKTNHKELN